MRIPFILLCFLFCFQPIFSQEDGPFKEYFDEGQLKIEGQYLNNKRIGEWKNYYRNGQVAKIYNYENGKLNKENKRYYKDGTLSNQTQKEGDHYLSKSYYESGELRSERILKNGYYKEFLKDGTLQVQSNYSDYQLSGTWNRYYENGQIEWSVEYEDGYRNGAFKKFYKNGQLHLEGEIVKEILEGEEMQYSEAGNLLWKGTYKNGTFNKTWINYDKDGAKVAKFKYKDGVLVNQQEGNNLIPTKVPDGLIERVPVYPGCNTALGNRLKKKCMNEKISRFIVSNFNTDVLDGKGIVGKQKIIVLFKIDKTGAVTKVKARTSYPELEEEAIRVIKLLPKMEPGYQRGKYVIVPYALPISFQFK